MVRIRSVKPLTHYRVELTLTNDKKKIIDLEPYFSAPIFAPIRKSRGLFETVHVDEELGTIVWDNGADVDPDVLTNGLRPAWLEKETVQSRR